MSYVKFVSSSKMEEKDYSVTLINFTTFKHNLNVRMIVAFEMFMGLQNCGQKKL